MKIQLQQIVIASPDVSGRSNLCFQWRRLLRRVCTTTLLAMTAVWSIGCFDLDSSLFNNDALTSYNLRTTVIPESSRTQIVLTSQGKKIYGYLVKSPNANESNIILYNHGNRDHLQYYWDRVELFYTMGFNVFIYDYQGYGMSEGEPGEAAIYSDATEAYAFVRSQRFADSSITVYGFSLGGAPAIHLASSVFTPRRLITEAAFASASALTKSATLLDLPGSYVMKGEYKNDEKIKNVHAPVLILHGVNDTFIDMEKNGNVLFNNANDPKRFIAVSGADHSDLPAKMGEAVYLQTIKDFVLFGL
ncbi:MAG: alpha/beta hydrolase [Ignavibacteriales bacterium]|nr:alpha/beta hydrolase [Ignavibacteriales bacterium]